MNKIATFQPKISNAINSNGDTFYYILIKSVTSNSPMQVATSYRIQDTLLAFTSLISNIETCKTLRDRYIFLP